MHAFLIGLAVVISIVMIVIVAIQDSTTDGLQGQIGSATATSFKGKAGREDRLNAMTKNIAIALFVCCILVMFFK